MEVEPHQLKRRILAEIEAENWQGALELLEGWCGHFPTDARGWVNRGYCLMRLERFAEALVALDRSLMMDPGLEKAVELRRYIESRLQAPLSAKAASMGPRRTKQLSPKPSGVGPTLTHQRAATATGTGRWRSTRQATFATFGRQPATEAERVWRERTVVAGRYDVLEVLRGGMGVVYIAFDRELQRLVAVKTPLPSVLASQDGRARFQREAEAWIALGIHPNVCSALYVQEIGGMPRLFIEYVNGGDLDGLLRSNQNLSLADRLDIVIQIASGMDYTHSFEWTDDDGVEHHGLVHRDLKPANVLMTRDGVARVTDFGLVRSKSAGGRLADEELHIDRVAPSGEVMGGESLGGGSWQTVTAAGGVLGTPPYLAPELWRKSGRASAASDLYAFGCLLYEIFCGRRPFAVETNGDSVDRTSLLAEWMRAHVSEPPPDPARWTTGLDSTVTELMKRCIAKRPEERPESFADIRQSLVAVYERCTRSPYPRPEPQRARLLADSLNNRAVSYVTLGNAIRGSRALQAALDVDPNHLEATYNRALVEWRSKGLTDAEMVRRLEEAARTSTDRSRARHLLGKLHLLLDNPTAALVELRNAAAAGDGSLDLKRDTGFALLAAARTGGGRELYLEADRQLGEVIETSGTELAPLVGRAEALMAVADETAAAETWQRAREQAPDLPEELSEGVSLLLPGHKPALVIRQSDPVQWTALLGGDRLACRDSTGAVTVWDLPTARNVAVLKITDPVRRGRSIAAIVGTQEAVISLSDQPMGIWDLSTGERVRGFRTHPGQPTCVEVTPDGAYVVTGGSDRRVRVWESSSGECRLTLEGHEAFVTDVAVDSAGRHVLSASSDGTLRFWDIDEGRCSRVLHGHQGPVNVVGWAPEEWLAVSGGADGTVRVWDLRSGAMLRTMIGHGGAVTTLQLAAGKTGIVLSGGEDRTVRVWDLETGSPLRVVRLQQHGVSDLKIPPEGSRFLVAHGATVAAYDLPEDVIVRLPLAVTEPIETAELEAREARVGALLETAGARIAGGEYEAAIQPLREARQVEGYRHSEEVLDLWGEVLAYFPKSSPRGHAELRQLVGHEAQISAVAFTVDAHGCVSAGADGTVRLWRLAGGDDVRVFTGHVGAVTDVALSADSERLSSAGRDGTVRVWGVADGERPGEATTGADVVSSVAFCPDGHTVISGGNDGRILRWRFDEPAPPEVIGRHEDAIMSLAVSEDGRFVACGGWDRDVVVWSLTRKTELQRFSGFEGVISAVAVSPDCRLIAGAGDDGLVRIWDRTSERCWRVLKGHDGPVLSVAFSPDARFMASGGKDATLRLWDLRTGRCVQVVEGHTGPVSAVAFDHDGLHLLSGGADASVRHWYLDWEPEVSEGMDWDDRARPFLDVFLRSRYDANPVGDRPSWTDAQFEQLRADLARRGFGWLDRDRVLLELESAAASWAEHRGREQRVVDRLAQRQQRRQLLEPLKNAAGAFSRNLSYRLIAAVLVAILVPLAIMSLRSPRRATAEFNRTLFHEIDLAFQHRVTQLMKGRALAFQGKKRTVMVGGAGACSGSSFPEYLDLTMHPERFSPVAFNPGMMASDEVFRVRYSRAIKCLGEVGGNRVVQPILKRAQADLHIYRVEDLLSVLVRAGDSAIPPAVEALSSASAPTRHLAAMSLVYRNRLSAAEPLAKALDDGNRKSFEAASYVLVELILIGAVPEEEAFHVVRRLAQSIDPRVRRNAIRALLLFERAGPMRDLLEEALRDSDRGVVLAAREVEQSLRAATARKYFGIDLDL